MKKLFIIFLFTFFISCSDSDNCDAEVAVINEKYTTERQEARDLLPDNPTDIEVQAMQKRIDILTLEETRAIENACH